MLYILHVLNDKVSWFLGESHYVHYFSTLNLTDSFNLKLLHVPRIHSSRVYKQENAEADNF